MTTAIEIFLAATIPGAIAGFAGFRWAKHSVVKDKTRLENGHAQGNRMNATVVNL